MAKGPIQWDGTVKGANRVLRHIGTLAVATTGGAPGFPVSLYLRDKRGRIIGEAASGDWIDLDSEGNARVTAAPQTSR